ncbi:hypothetical protein NY2A_b066L [Paramecium bursaria Chlorella virus NY2A]|uniref:Uncharacterized protein b066L n=1 Tax=Paramecium bursaria Chlorella virus NY2A TaxID=46021 RepID=A7IVU1_PBCVN|nr:hypothetical protein NY2A_b066L [Paramecium bursaria Chlorella virus NY2A]ABT14465.1 hypothetical protein NY2A_b066L [Paramecium bursaria Chlorella virus NY2A]
MPERATSIVKLSLYFKRYLAASMMLSNSLTIISPSYATHDCLAVFFPSYFPLSCASFPLVFRVPSLRFSGRKSRRSSSL